jgi:hypothetical protein
MTSTWPRISRDPIHNLTAFHDRPWHRLLLDLINTCKVQRLCWIKKISLGEVGLLVCPAPSAGSSTRWTILPCA